MSRTTSPPPVTTTRRDFSPPRIRSPPPFAPIPRIFSPNLMTSPPPTNIPSNNLGGYISPHPLPPPVLQLQPSTPVSNDQTSTGPTTKSLDAIHEVSLEQDHQDLPLPKPAVHSSPQRKPINGTSQPIEGQRSMTLEVTSKPATNPEKEKNTITSTSSSKSEQILKSVKSNDTIRLS